MKTSGILLLVLLSTTSFAVKRDPAGRLLMPELRSASVCQDRPEFLTELRSDLLGSISQIPETVLVARDAEVYVDGTANGEAFKIHAYQSFLKPEDSSAEILCATTPADFKERFSIYAPTLIDTKKVPKVGHSLWQFQLLADSGKFAFWNFKSTSLKPNQNLEDFLKTSGATYKIYQKTHTEFELMLVKKTGDVTEYLSITYDAVPRLK